MHIDYIEGVVPPTDRDIYFHSSKQLEAGGRKLIEAIETLHHDGRLEVCKHLLKPLMEVAVKNLQAFAPSEIPNTINLGNEIVAYLREHREQSISRKQLSKVFRVSQGYISRVIRTCLGKTFEEIQQELRLEHAATLLLNTRLSVNEISERCGYNYANYFIRRFVKKYGMTPLVFRNKQRAANKEK
ncbi:MAG: AraC family transcriptional regulator [Lentisphaeria bacterium]|nr:AraC family transcriptional regulator [Lentisphaeria bacterium]